MKGKKIKFRNARNFVGENKIINYAACLKNAVNYLVT